MKKRLPPELVPPAGEGESGGLRGRVWKRFVAGPDKEILEELYQPGLARALRYDRCCAYFSSSVLAAAARGFAALIERLETIGPAAPKPAVRLVVNEELSEEDVKAMAEKGDNSALEAALQRRFKNPKDSLEKERLAMLAWLAKQGYLGVRVGVMRRGEGILHAKFGLMTDGRGDVVVFSGSGNETAQGLLGNYERLEVSTSWKDPERHAEHSREFELLWLDKHPTVYTVPLPEALRLKLIRFAPKEPPAREPSQALARQKAAMTWQFICEAPYLPNGAGACDATAMVDLWPHQRRVVEETAEAWPDGRLLCDEVGMGKTIEAILVLRRLLAGRGVRRALLLLPAGLLKQWQAELREKGGMLFPRLEGLNTLAWPDGKSERVPDLATALRQDVLLVSRETARTDGNLPILLAADPWDLVILDESHAARRKKPEEGEFNIGTLLLDLLRQLQLQGKARGFLLMSATPMQMHPWEPWDLLSVLGEGGVWLSEFAGIRGYYAALAARAKNRCDFKTAVGAARLIAGDPNFPDDPAGNMGVKSTNEIARLITFAPPTQGFSIADWLRKGSPLARRMHRNTRATLRRYYEMGLLESPPPTRNVEDVRFDFASADERAVYESVADYIEKRFKELEQEKPGKGFVMTIYRRRASSSPHALRESLGRRADGLRRVASHMAYEQEFWSPDLDPRDVDFAGLEASGKISAALPTDPEVARRELKEVEALGERLDRLGARDSKRDRFFDELRRITEDGRAVLVFTEYSDTMDYLRDQLVVYYGARLGCYSGDGGQIWDGNQWKMVSKDLITAELRAGRLQVLVCTDAASEGLNLQAAGAVINYDLPWNPSKVEQRIGRVDRIGQRLADVRVVNLFLEDSVDDEVYSALRSRCKLFEHFVGPMQPVLAQARRMLLGALPFDIAQLDAVAKAVEADPLATETYVEDQALPLEADEVPLSRSQIIGTLEAADPAAGFETKRLAEAGVLRVVGSMLARRSVATTSEALERDQALEPLSPFTDSAKEFVRSLSRPGELLPLVIGSHQDGAFRRSAVLWASQREAEPVTSLDNLRSRLDMWDGIYPEPARRLKAEEQARALARQQVESLKALAEEREERARLQQVAAARLRLQRELGRYLLSLDSRASNLNEVLHQWLSRDIASAVRLRGVLDKLGGYPEWPADLVVELREQAKVMTPNDRKAIVIGGQIDAALQDPRWTAAMPRKREEAQTA